MQKNSHLITEKMHFANVSQPHIEPFNFVITTGLALLTKIPPLNNPTGPKVDVSMMKPMIEGEPLYPSEARCSHLDYSGTLSLKYRLTIDGEVEEYTKTVKLPVMVMSKACHLDGMSPSELVRHKEEQHEFGGVFILKGAERLIRLIIANKRNFPLAMERSSWGKDTNFTTKGIMVRSVREDESTTMNVLHYLNNGNCIMTFGNPSKFNIPAILLMKCLKETTDKEIYIRILQGMGNSKFIHERVEFQLQEFGDKFSSLINREACLRYLGETFMRTTEAREEEFIAAGQAYLDAWLLPHLTKGSDKFNFIVLMIQKLFMYANGEVIADDQDSIVNQEVLTGPQVYIQLLRNSIEKTMQMGFAKTSVQSAISKLASCVGQIQKSSSIEETMRRLFSTGNVAPSSGMSTSRLELPQFSGYSIIAEKLNFSRYLSHFRSIHRGVAFQESKITTVRKLRQESWGFICPVHTPDGAPCGLLNHLSNSCHIVAQEVETADLIDVLIEYGMSHESSNSTIPILLDGKWIGNIENEIATKFCQKLRYLRSTGSLPKMLEIAMFPRRDGSLFPLIGLYAHRFRFMRPVMNLASKKEEYIGAGEQLFLNIACMDADFHESTTHQEVTPLNILSYLGTLTPFSDFNQSPRNVYQCQMAKQTMAFPLHSFKYRTDNKLYRLQTPQRPIVRTSKQAQLPFDDYPGGTNAVVAVISHTGYDMDDAMIVNKSSYERGFAHGSVIKAKLIDLTIEYKEYGVNRDFPLFFANTIPGENKAKFNETLDWDGLPYVGSHVKEGSPIYCIYDRTTNNFKVHTWKLDEEAYVDAVKLMYREGIDSPVKMEIIFRQVRNPTIGDKFSSRHGQKGVLSVLWPTIDMPFTESGVVPDCIINPHAFPSRMTIGMLLESAAGKAGALHGFFPDASPFQFDEKNRAVDHLGDYLKKAGYNYYGNETMTCGTLGTEFRADIFLGVVYYQRLRHMVKDKFQARDLGQVSNLTHQPIKGRKVGGGIRFGEMERDGLLSYGASFLIRDRLFQCSDEDFQQICTKCGGFLNVASKASGYLKDYYCRYCESGDSIERIRVPHVFKYLANELAAMNILVKVELKDF